MLTARVDPERGGSVGVAVELERLAELALERAGAAQWPELGFEARVLERADAKAGEEGTDGESVDAPVATARPGAPFDTLRPTVRPIDFAARVRAERSRFALAVAGFVVALLAAVLAWLGW